MMKKGKTAGIGAVILAACLLGGCSNALSDGIRALEDGEYEEARDYFQSAVEEDGDKTAEAYRGLGMAYYEMEDYSPALEAFQTACGALPGCLREVGDALAQVVRTGADDPDALVRLQTAAGNLLRPISIFSSWR